MKKFVTILFSLILIVLAVNSVSARQNPAPSPFRVKNERAETVRASVEARLLRRRENIGRFFDLMIRGLKAMVARLEILISRIESRLEKIASENPG